MGAQVDFYDVNTFFGVDGHKEVLQGDEALINCLLNIFIIPRRSRKRVPEFGSYAYAILQEPVSAMSAAKLKTSIQQSIREWLPYVDFDYHASQINPNKDNTGYNIILVAKSLLTGFSISVNFTQPAVQKVTAA